MVSAILATWLLALVQPSAASTVGTATYDVEVAPAGPLGPPPPIIFNHIPLTLEQRRDDVGVFITGTYKRESLQLRLGADESFTLGTSTVSVANERPDTFTITPPGVNIVEQLESSSDLRAQGTLYRQDEIDDRVVFDETLDAGGIQKASYTTYVRGTIVGRLTFTRTEHSGTVAIPRLLLGCIASSAFVQLRTGSLTGLHCFDVDTY